MSKHLQLSAAAAAVAAAFTAVPAHAAVTIAGTGASAIQNALVAAVLTDYCAGSGTTNTISVYDSVGTAPTTFPKGSTFTISCPNPGTTGISASPFVVSYDATGGSWKAFTATTPSLLAAAQADYTANGGQNIPMEIDPANQSSCTANGSLALTLTNGVKLTVNSYYNCPLTPSTPTFGFTDVEPKLFTGTSVNQPFEWGTWNTGGVPLVTSFAPGAEPSGYPYQAFGVVFGVAASGALWAAMQNDQLTNGVLPTSICGTAFSAGASSNTLEVCTPIISREMYASLIATTGGAALNDAQTLFITPPTASKASNGIPALEVARRDQGSGTQSGSNATFLGQGCDVAATETPDTPVTPDLSTTEDPSGGYINNSFTYNLSTGDVLNRLQGINPTADGFVNFSFPSNQYVIGAVSGEKYSASSINGSGAFGTSTAPWGFLRLDGVLPTNQRVYQGLYSYTTTEYFHCATGLSGDQLKLCTDLTTPTFADSLAKYAAGQSGGSVPTGIYPIQSVTTYGTYFTNGRTCAGARHH